MKRLFRKGIRITFTPGGKMTDPRNVKRTDGLKDIAEKDNEPLLSKIRKAFGMEE